MLVLVGVCASLLIYYGALRPSYPAAQELKGDPIQLADVLDNRFYARHNNATWISDTELMFRDVNVSINARNEAQDLLVKIIKLGVCVSVRWEFCVFLSFRAIL